MLTRVEGGDVSGVQAGDDHDSVRPAKEMLSWAIAASVLLGTDEPLGLIELHPGGGSYDCLGLVAAEGVLFMVNRAGHSATIGDRIDSEFWEALAATGSVSSIADRVIVDLDLPSPRRAVPSLTALAALNVANWLNHASGDVRTAVSAWFDSSNGYGPNADVIESFPVPEAWESQEPPAPNLEGLAWVFALMRDGKHVALVNLRNGAAIDPAGRPWNTWPELDYDRDGLPAFAIAATVTAHLRGEVMATLIGPPGEIWRMKRPYLEEYCDPITVEPTFTVHPSYLQSRLLSDR